MNKLKKIKLFQVISLVLIFLVFGLIMISFSFPDLFAMFYVPNWIAEGKLDVYSLVRFYKPYCTWVSATWPPLYYYVFGAYLYLVKGLGLLKSNLFTSSACPFTTLIYNQSFLFWAKLPLLIFHTASAWIFSKFFTKKQFYWFLIWLLNPIAIFVTLIQGQFEIIPTFFIILALYYAKNKQIYLSALSLGIGGAFKHIPFLLAIPFILILTRNLKEKFYVILILVIPYIVTILPVFGAELRQSLFFPENYKMLGPGLNILGFHLSYYLFSYLTLCFILFFHIKHTKKNKWRTLLKYTYFFLVIYFFFTDWFAQRLLILLPSLLLLASKDKKLWLSLPFVYFTYFIYVLLGWPGLFDKALLHPMFIRSPFITNLAFNFSQGLRMSLESVQYFAWGLITLVLLIVSYFVYKTKLKQLVRTKPIHLFVFLSSLVIYLITIIFQ